MGLVHVAFGGNVGDVRTNVADALVGVGKLPGTWVSTVSDAYRTAPVGVTDQPDFLNGVAAVETMLGPRELLTGLLTIEKELGRTRELRWGPRTVDLDIVLWGDEVINEEGLQIPHPRMHERGFVLAPLAEIAPEAVHPLLRKTVSELLGELGSLDDIHREGPLVL